jgi:4-hydroxybenzoate polyprenyltransferase
MLALGRLLRLSLAPSAPADIAAGVVLAAGCWPGGPEVPLLMLASSCVYHGGMALNDWADRAGDARDRRSRPIPLGQVRPATALLVAALLLAGGAVLALSVSLPAGACLASVAFLAALYDLGGRGPWVGPLLLACCRAGNLGAGLLLGLERAAFAPALAIPPLGYGLYVFLISRLARLEDAPEEVRRRGRPAAWAMASGLLLLGIGLWPWFPGASPGLAPGASPLPRLCPLALAAAGASGLCRAAWRRRGSPWSAADVRAVAGMALRRLLVASAALATAALPPVGIYVGGAILLGYPLSLALRRIFPPT